MASLETVNEIESEEASRLLTTYADLKMKETETLQDMVALIKADDLGPRQCYESVKHVTKVGRGHPRNCPGSGKSLIMNQSN